MIGRADIEGSKSNVAKREVSICWFEIESPRALVCPKFIRVEKRSPNKPLLLSGSLENAMETS